MILRIEKNKHYYTVWYGNQHPINKCVTFGFHLNKEWLIPSKDNPLCFFRTNGAVKGKDNCLDINVKIWFLHFGYTDWSYWRFRQS